MRRWLTVGTWDEGDVILRISGSGFPGLPPLLCCSGPVGLAYLGAFVHGGTPHGPVHGCLFPGVGGDGKMYVRSRSPNVWGGGNHATETNT